MTMQKKILAAVLATGSLNAHAAWTGYATGTSEYMFRGIESSDGPAIQGALNYLSNDVFGLYAGVWGSNTTGTSGANQSELDLSVGFSGNINDDFGFDLGGIYYFFPEGGSKAPKSPGATAFDPSFPELYFGLNLGILAVKVNYTNDYFASQNEALLISGALTLEFTETVAIVGQVGLNGGDGVKRVFGKEYTNFSAKIVKKMEGDYEFSLGVHGTDIQGPFAPAIAPPYSTQPNGVTGSESDSAKVVVSLTKNFKI